MAKDEPKMTPPEGNGASRGNGHASSDETAELHLGPLSGDQPVTGNGNGAPNGKASTRDGTGAAIPLAAPGADGKAPGDYGFIRESFRAFGRTLREAVRYGDLRKTPYGMTPALLMGLIFFVQSFDGNIFSLVLPDIVQETEINAPALISAVNLLGFFLIFGTIGLAFALDRMRRIPFFVGGVVGNGLFSLAVSRSNTVWTIGASRAADSLSGEAFGVPLFSLQADYYPPETRGRMFAFTASLARLGRFGAPLLIAYVVAATTWRVPYLVTGPLLILLGIVAAFKLKEPIRGYMERRALGRHEAEAVKPEEPPSFGEAWRTIWGIRTLRRLFIGSIFGNGGDRIFGLLFGLFLFEAYHMQVVARGWLLFVSGIFSLIGGIIGGGIVDTLMRRRPSRVLIFSGLISLTAAVFLGFAIAKPPVWVLYVAFSLFGLFGALLGPARSVFYASILPANMRTMGLAVFVLANIPALILAQIFLVRVPTWGLQGVLAAAVPFMIIGSIIDISSAQFFERDTRNALLSQMASEEYRRARDAGTLKLLVCRGVEVEYSGVQVLFGADFEVTEGEIIALLGTNGAGKSTLLKAIAGTHEASGGAIVFDGRDVTHVPPYEIAARGIVLMPGGKGVFPDLTVRENLMLGTWTMEEAEGKERLDEVLAMFPTLQKKLGARAQTMSGGEQQMLALAMAFLSKPRLLLIDELSLGLAPHVVQELLEAVRSMRDKGITIVLVEQSVNVALTVAERAVFMEKGEVRFEGPTKELLRRPDILRAVYVKGSATVGADDDDGAWDRTSARLAASRSILEISDLSVAFGGVQALKDVTFDLKDGEILGIIGPNGAGKTTLFDVISGFTRADAGRVVLEGQDVADLPPDKRAKLHLVRRWQDARLYPSLTVHEALLVALDRHHKGRSMVSTALQLPRSRASERTLRRRADELIELLGLGNARDKFVKELSTGMRRIVDLACTMATEPRVLLLDEPSSGIAQAEAEAMAPLLRRVRAETGCSMMLIEHDMPLITRAADELMAMVQGQVVVRGSADEVLSHPVVVESYLGTSEEVVKRSGALT